MTKKLISLLLTAILVFALAACGQAQQTEPMDSSAADTQPGGTANGEETPS